MQFYGSNGFNVGQGSPAGRCDIDPGSMKEILVYERWLAIAGFRNRPDRRL
jgi:hypothetical protein